jgi:hypothetical protein
MQTSYPNSSPFHPDDCTDYDDVAQCKLNYLIVHLSASHKHETELDIALETICQ